MQDLSATRSLMIMIVTVTITAFEKRLCSRIDTAMRGHYNCLLEWVTFYKCILAVARFVGNFVPESLKGKFIKTNLFAMLLK